VEQLCIYFEERRWSLNLLWWKWGDEYLVIYCEGKGNEHLRLLEEREGLSTVREGGIFSSTVREEVGVISISSMLEFGAIFTSTGKEEGEIFMSTLRDGLPHLHLLWGRWSYLYISPVRKGGISVYQLLGNEGLSLYFLQLCEGFVGGGHMYMYSEGGRRRGGYWSEPT